MCNGWEWLETTETTTKEFEVVSSNPKKLHLLDKNKEG